MIPTVNPHPYLSELQKTTARKKSGKLANRRLQLQLLSNACAPPGLDLELLQRRAQGRPCLELLPEGRDLSLGA
jgi:hypothetical protein